MTGPVFFLILGITMVVVGFGFLCLKRPTPMQWIEEGEEDESVCTSISRMITMMKSKKMLMITPELCLTGITIAFYSSQLVPIMTLQQRPDERYADLTPN